MERPNRDRAYDVLYVQMWMGLLVPLLLNLLIRSVRGHQVADDVSFGAIVQMAAMLVGGTVYRNNFLRTED